MADHTLDIPTFRAMFPVFTAVLYPDALLTAMWPIVTCAIDDVDSCAISGDCLQTALYLMLAHITWILNGPTGTKPGPVGVKTQAQVDKVSVTYAPPPFKSGWQAWLSQTPYGLTLWAMLSTNAAGGWYVTGRAPESDAFRKSYGRFRG